MATINGNITIKPPGFISGSDGFTNFLYPRSIVQLAYIWRSGASTVTVDIAVAPDVLLPLYLVMVIVLTSNGYISSAKVPTK